ncbi:unnamed protein product [Thelazia callipaeda]|uniref:Set apart in position or space protein n=1 Tax=Thelazia callipaeda TaxID=103827 RepID=A0A158RBK9_THECL|nr:unnamed protein product [Thelazia callipaeda]
MGLDVSSKSKTLDMSSSEDDSTGLLHSHNVVTDEIGALAAISPKAKLGKKVFYLRNLKATGLDGVHQEESPYIPIYNKVDLPEWEGTGLIILKKDYLPDSKCLNKGDSNKKDWYTKTVLQFIGKFWIG